MDTFWRWGVVLVSAAVLLVMGFVPLPGLLADVAQYEVSIWETSVATGVWMPVMVASICVGALPSRSQTPVARRLAIGVSLAIVGSTYITFAPGLQELGTLAAGRGTIYLGAASRIAVAAIAWFVASSLDELGQDGVFLIAIPDLALGIVDWHVTHVDLALSGRMAVGAVLASPLLPLVIVFVGLGLRRRPLPISVVGSLEFRTFLPLLSLPIIVGELIMGQVLHTDLLVAFPSMPRWTLLLAGHTMGTALALWLVWRGSSVGVRALPTTVGAGLALVFVGFSVGLTLASGLPTLPWKRAYAGTDRVQVSVAYNDTLSDADLEILRERLAEAGAVSITRQRPTQVQIDVSQTDGERVIDHLERRTRPGHLRFHPVDPTLRYTQLRALIDLGDPGEPDTWGALPRGLSWGIEGCVDGGRWEATCVVYALQPAELTDADVEAAEVRYTEEHDPVVAIQLTADGAQRFGEMTERMVDERFAIVLDDEVLSAPSILEPIWGGRLQLMMGDRVGDAREEARNLAVALRLEPLTPTRRTEFVVLMR